MVLKYDDIESCIDKLKAVQTGLTETDQDEAANLIFDAILTIINAVPERIKNVYCPQCKKPFTLEFDDVSYGVADRSLRVYSCPSGGVYSMTIHCPHCDYKEDL